MPHTDSTTPPAPPEQGTVGGHLRMIAQLNHDREALVVPGQEYRATYGELSEQTGLAARGLMATGVARGDRVGIWAPDRYEGIVLGLAAARAGAILVVIDPACDAPRLGDALGSTETRLLAMSRSFRGADHDAVLAKVRERCSELRCVLMLDREWHPFLEEGTHVSECDLIVREASVAPDDRLCVLPIAVTHRELLAGSDRTATWSGLAALAVILRGACAVVPSGAPA